MQASPSLLNRLQDCRVHGVYREGHQKAVVPPPALSPDQGQEAGVPGFFPLVSPLLDLVQ